LFLKGALKYFAINHMEKDTDNPSEFGLTPDKHDITIELAEKSKEKKKKLRQDRREPLLKGLGALAEQSLPEEEKQPVPKALKVPEISHEPFTKSKNTALDTMSRVELLETSEKIVVGATTLRQVFETHLISERGLRQAVNEYRRGGDVRRVLAEELLIKELGYELDPQLRDRRPSIAPAEDLTAEHAASYPEALLPTPSDTLLPETIATKFLPPAEPLVQHHRVPVPLIIANGIALIVLAILLFVLIMIRV
jgi:hypothetical protein